MTILLSVTVSCIILKEILVKFTHDLLSKASSSKDKLKRFYDIHIYRFYLHSVLSVIYCPLKNCVKMYLHENHPLLSMCQIWTRTSSALLSCLMGLG